MAVYLVLLIINTLYAQLFVLIQNVQHATVSATKLKAKERELQSKRDQLDVTKKRVAQLRSKLAGSTAEIKVTGPVELPDRRQWDFYWRQLFVYVFVLAI